MARKGKVENENDITRDAFGNAIANALRDGDARMHLPPDFAARLRTATPPCGAARMPHVSRPLRKAAAILVLLGLGAFAATIAYRQIAGEQKLANTETNERQKEGTNMIMARKVASLVGASLLAVATPGEEITSEPTFVFLRPETSSFWNTATNSTMTLPIDYPRGATKAMLTVSGAGYAAKTYPNITEPSFELELPVPDSPQNENVYDLTLTFDDGTVRTAKLGLIQGLSPDSEGSTRCLAPAEGDVWNTIKKRAVLPIPYGTESFTISVNGGAVTEVDTGLNGAQGWYVLKPTTGDSVSLALMVGGVNYVATLLGKGDGFFVIMR